VSDSERVWLALGAVVLLVLGLAPPLTTWARHYEFVEALQFSVFAMVVPALLTCGAPWRFLRLAGTEGTGAGRAMDRLAAGRRRHPEFVRAFIPWLLFVAAIVAWRTPAAVDGVTRHFWLLVAEAASFAVVGVVLWLELVESPPLLPRSPRPRRLAQAAFSMWAVWVLAYTEAMSNTSWYSTFHHSAGHGLGASADHQVSTIVIWLVAAAAFMPVIFWNLYFWLRNDEDPDDELFRLMKEERRRAWQVPKTLGGDPPA
jgi:cytochrome c oxidase assembly factor CtaG